MKTRRTHFPNNNEETLRQVNASAREFSTARKIHFFLGALAAE